MGRAMASIKSSLQGDSFFSSAMELSTTIDALSISQRAPSQEQHLHRPFFASYYSQTEQVTIDMPQKESEDFVRSGSWSLIGQIRYHDLPNANMYYRNNFLQASGQTSEQPSKFPDVVPRMVSCLSLGCDRWLSWDDRALRCKYILGELLQVFG